MDFLDGKFYVSISTEPIENKDTNIWNRITYKRQNVTLTELKNLITKQYAFCGVFENEVFNQKQKLIPNWLSTNIVCLDLDDRKKNYNEFIDIVENSDYKPNLIYRTQNDQIKGNRYRALYVFDSAIVNAKLYAEIYTHLFEYINTITDDRNGNKDNCGISVNQSFAGTNKADDLVIDTLYYDIKGICKVFGISTLNISDLHNRKLMAEKEPKQKKVIKQFDNFDFSNYSLMYDDFANDFNTLSLTDILQKYNGKYYNYECTQLNEVSEEIAYIEIPSNYIEIKRYWYLEENAIKNNKCSQIRKIKDGMCRRKKLYVNAIIRRLIYKELTFDNLLYNLVFEFYYYMINDGNKITKSDLFEICQRAFNADIDLPKYQKYIIGNRDKKFIVNSAYCIKHNVSKKQAVRIATKQRNYNKIGLYYNCLLSDKENLKVLKENGIDISLRTLKNFKEENGLTKKRNKKVQKQLYKEEERNISLCNCTFKDNEEITHITVNVENIKHIETRNKNNILHRVLQL